MQLYDTAASKESTSIRSILPAYTIRNVNRLFIGTRPSFSLLCSSFPVLTFLNIQK